jgi:SNF2 family DNA or RNA helicase
MNLIVSKANKSLLVPHTPAVANLFPGAKLLPHGKGDAAIIPHGLRESLLLRHIGFKVPNPMLLYYDWKGGKPFKVQRATCALLTTAARAYVLNDMGTGKTKAALWAWDWLNTQGYAGKLLVVAPLSTLNFVWAREAFATLPKRKVAILHGTKAQREERLRDTTVDIYVINHDGLRVIQDELFQRKDIDTLVLDELAVYRNNTDRSKRMRQFADRFVWVWGMTGAPMPNAPTDVWGQAKIVTPNSVPKFFRIARDQLMTRVNQFKFIPKPDAVETAFAMMQPAVRFSLDDVVELPETVSRTIDVELSAQQDKVYKKMVTEFRAMIEEKQITAVNAGAAMNKLLQVAGGWVYTAAPEFVELDCHPRTDALLELVNSSARKVLVFVPYRHALAGLSKLFNHKDNKISHELVHGDTKDRDQIFNKFQNTTGLKALLAHPQCLAHGLTLTAADTIIWYLPTASLEMYEQANARIRRVGQKHRQQILHIQSTPVEKKLYRLLAGKQKIQDKLLSLFEVATGSVS